MTKRPFSKKTESIEIRVAPEMKKSFVERCKADRRSASEVMRFFMEDYASAKGGASKPSGKESSMFGLLSSRFVRLVAVTGGIVSLGVMSSPSTASDARLEALFHWLDGNGDGTLIRGELFDEDKNSPALLAGAEVMLTTLDRPGPGETAEEVFNRVDVSGDGRITLMELAETVRVDSRVGATLLQADHDASNSLTTAELAARITEARAAADEPRPAAGAALMAEGLLSAHDANGDGQLVASELTG